MSLLQNIVLVKSLRKSIYDVNRFSNYFHLSLILQSGPDVFDFQYLLYPLEVTATQSWKLKSLSIQHLLEQP